MTNRSQFWLRFLFFVLVFVCLPTAALGAQILGYLDVPRGYPVPQNAEVALKMASGSLLETAIAQGNGHFSFERVGAGSYVITVRAEGYRPVSQDVDVPSGYLGASPFTVSIRLFPDEKPEGRPPSEKTVQVQSLQVPSEAIQQVQLAEKAAAGGSLDEAIQHLEKAVEIYPTYFEAYNNLAVYQYQAGRPEKAVQFFERALVLNPDAAGANANLGRVLLELNQPEKAIRFLDHAAKVAPASSEIQYHLARAYILSSALRESIKPLNRALELQPPVEHARYLLANVLYQLGDLSGAVRELEQYLKTKPRNGRELEQTIQAWKREARRKK